MTIISFQEAKEARQPHYTGEVKCIGCGYEYVATAPMGVLWLDCPECKLTKATPKYRFAPVGDDISCFSCVSCDCEAMNIYKKAGELKVMCMNCGSNLTDAAFNG